MAQAAPIPHAVILDQLVWSSFWRAVTGARTEIGAAIAVLILFSLLRAFLSRRPRRSGTFVSSRRRSGFHFQTQIRARYALRKLSGIDPRRQPSLAFQFLRSVCPFTFEEMILLQLAARKIAVQRNVAYTGDGGVDGRFVVADQLWLVQAKKYSGMVRASDIMDFAAVCEAQGARGLFVHTGRTPSSAHTIARESRSVDILSGDRLITFFAGEKLRLRPAGEAVRATSPLVPLGSGSTINAP